MFRNTEILTDTDWKRPYWPRPGLYWQIAGLHWQRAGLYWQRARLYWQRAGPFILAWALICTSKAGIAGLFILACAMSCTGKAAAGTGGGIS